MNAIASAKPPTVCGIEVTDRVSRLVAADRAEESGLSDLASQLRVVSSPLLVSYDGETCHGRRLTLPASYHKLLKTVKDWAGTGKRSVTVAVAETVDLFGRYWDEGTRYRYTAGTITAHGGRNVLAFGSTWPDTSPFRTLSGEDKIRLSPRTVVVQTCVYCGKETCPTLFIHPDDARLLGLTYVPAYPEE